MLAWLRSTHGHEIKATIVAEETWATPRVLIVQEGSCVSVYVEGDAIVKCVERPIVRMPAGNDRSDEILRERVGYYWSEVHRPSRFRMTFWTDQRSLRERVIERFFLKPIEYMK